MKNNFYTQMQMDVMNTANNMVIQQVCADQGIDYNKFLMQAQQEHLNKIIAAEQQRQIEKMAKRYYQGNSGNFFSKVRDAFTDDAPNMIIPTNGLPMMGVPMQPMVNPAMQNPVANHQAQAIEEMFISEIPLKSETDARIDALENKMNEVTDMLTQITNLLKK